MVATLLRAGRDEEVRLYDRGRLQPLLAPLSVAVVGPSSRRGTVGYAVAQNLLVFGRPVYLIHPKRKRLFGQPVYRDLSAVPGGCVDLVVVACQAVEDVLEQAAAGLARAVLAIPAGFAETGDEGAVREAALFAKAQAAEVLLQGPNCIGTCIPRSRFNPSFSRGMAPAGSLALLTNSGAIFTGVMDQCAELGIGLSGMFSFGNGGTGQGGVSWADMLEWFAFDPYTQIIGCYVESVARDYAEGRRFVRALQLAARRKRVVCLYAGRSPEGIKAKFSHTAALASDYRHFEGVAQTCGALVVPTLEDLLRLAQAAAQPLPRGNKVFPITNAGGPAVLGQDAGHAAGLEPFKLPAEVEAQLRAKLHPAAATFPSCDVLGTAGRSEYEAALRAAEDAAPGPDACVVIVTPQQMTKAEPIAKAAAEAALRMNVPIIGCFMGAASADMQRAAKFLRRNGIPVLADPSAAMRIIGQLRELELLKTQASFRLSGTQLSASPAASTHLDRIKQWQAQGELTLDPVDSANFFSGCGLPMAPLAVAFGADDAIQIAESFGFPVAVKLLPGTEAATHKKAAGGVWLDRWDKAAVLQAYDRIQRDVTAKHGAEAFGGVVVQAMQPRGAIELVMGILQTEFGPMVLVGEGGSHTEKRDDTVMAVPPFGAAWAEFLLRKLRIYPVLAAVEGAVEKVARMLAQLGDVACAYPQLVEADLNPVCVSKDAVIGVDARIKFSPAGTPLRSAVLRSYPAEYQTCASLQNGASVTIRPVRLEDRGGLASFARTLSQQTLRLRFGDGIGADDPRLLDEFLNLAGADYWWDCHFVASAQEQIVAVSSLRRARLSRSEESALALTVSDGWQRQGLGSAMLTQMIGVSSREGIAQLLAHVPTEAQGMIRLLGRSGFRVHRWRTGFYVAQRSLLSTT